jgi:hypothetical protein
VAELDFEIHETHRHPVVAADVLEALRVAVSAVPGVREAYLVDRKTTIDGREGLFRLGIAARLRTWRFRAVTSALNTALQPFDERAPAEAPLIWWRSYRNSPVDEEVRSVGVPVAQTSQR